MCHFTVDLNTCGHLSHSYMNTQRCHQGITDCRINPNGKSSSIDRLKELLSPGVKGKDSLRPQSLSFADSKRKSMVSIEINDTTACSRCQPFQYARYMERREGSEHRDFARKEAEAQRRTADVLGGAMEELDSMIQEGYKRGWRQEMRTARLEAGLRGKGKGEGEGKMLERHVRFALPVLEEGDYED